MNTVPPGPALDLTRANWHIGLPIPLVDELTALMVDPNADETAVVAANLHCVVVDPVAPSAATLVPAPGPDFAAALAGADPLAAAVPSAVAPVAPEPAEFELPALEPVEAEPV